MARTALVVGSTGLIGSLCVDRLLAHAAYTKVIALVRQKRSDAPSKLEERLVDFSALPTLEGIDDVYCAIGSTMKKAGSKEAFREIDFAIPLRVAEHAQPTRFALVSSVGASPTASSFYLRVKGELEEALAALPLAALHVFRPSILLGERNESRPAERVGIALAKATKGLLVGGLRKWRPIDAADVATGMVRAMQGPDSGKAIYEYDTILEPS